MKKVYLYCGLFLLGATSFAQRNASLINFGERALGNELTLKETRPTSQITHDQDRVLNVLWTENFTTGSGLATANGTWVTAGANGAYWTIANTVHPLDAYNWTHAMTGRHMRWDSYNPNDSEGSFATTVINGSITSPSMDLSGAVNGAILEFDTESMYCCNANEKPWTLYVSQNDGGTWSAPIPLDFGVDRNVATEDVAHPMNFSVDISSYISTTPGTVKIRIAWEATNADGNGQINTHYFWMLDNMTIYETPLYQIEHKKCWLADIAQNYEYGEIPLSQAGLLTIQSEVKSLGSNVPTSLALQVTVYDGSMVQIHQSTGGTLYYPPMSLGDIDTITFPTTFDLSAQTVGTYYVRVVTDYTETDEVPTNDTIWRSFDITDNVLSHMDFEQPLSANYQSITLQHKIGAVFTVENDVDLHGVEFYLSDGSTTTPASEDIEVEFYVHQAGTSTWDEIEGPFTFTITAAMLNQMNTFNLHNALEPYTTLTLLAGEAYIVSMYVYAGAVVWYGNTPIDGDNSGRVYILSGGSSNWFLSGDEPNIGLNFDASLDNSGIDEFNATTFKVGQNVPNPFNNSSVITYSLTEEANVSVQIVDVTGKLVKTVTPGNQTAGTYTITIDGAELAEGSYFYTFTVGDQKITKQMVVTK